MNDIQWYIRMMDLTQDTEDRMRLLSLVYNEWLIQWAKNAREEILTNLK